MRITIDTAEPLSSTDYAVLELLRGKQQPQQPAPQQPAPQPQQPQQPQFEQPAPQQPAPQQPAPQPQQPQQPQFEQPAPQQPMQPAATLDDAVAVARQLVDQGRQDALPRTLAAISARAGYSIQRVPEVPAHLMGEYVAMLQQELGG